VILFSYKKEILVFCKKKWFEKEYYGNSVVLIIHLKGNTTV